MSIVNRFLDELERLLAESPSSPASIDVEDRLIRIGAELELARDLAAIPGGATLDATKAYNAIARFSEPVPVEGTAALQVAIRGTRRVDLTAGTLFKWSNEERENLTVVLAPVNAQEVHKERFLTELARMMAHEALTAKYPLYNLRGESNRPYSPRTDIRNIDKALKGLEQAQVRYECLSMSWGLRALPVENHVQIMALIGNFTAAREKLARDFPEGVDGKRKFDKEQKIRIATQIAKSFRKHLHVDPVSTSEGPYHQLFMYCVDGLGLKKGGRWPDYYRPAFARLGIQPKRRRPAKRLID